MRQFLAIVRFEYTMGIRRWGMWLAFAIAGLTFLLDYADSPAMSRLAGLTTWQLAGSLAYLYNLLPVVVGGIVMADRLPRDLRLGTTELLWSTPLPRSSYVLGKYAGAVLTVLTPVLVIWLLGVGKSVVAGAPLDLFGPALLAFVAVVVPAYAFVGAFSIACTAILPVRVYQILFTGYWFWGNYIHPDFLPTLSGTLVTPSGVFAASGLFGTRALPGEVVHTPVEAWLNLGLLAACAAIALLSLELYLAWQSARA